jgi:hypothetical protein
MPADSYLDFMDVTKMTRMSLLSSVASTAFLAIALSAFLNGCSPNPVGERSHNVGVQQNNLARPSIEVHGSGIPNGPQRQGRQSWPGVTSWSRDSEGYGPCTPKEPPAVASQEKKTNALAADSIVGTWRTEAFHPWLGEWQNATACELIVRKLTQEEKQQAVEIPNPDGCQGLSVAIYLMNHDSRWRAPDSEPGWISNSGVLWLGPMGSALRFNLTLNDDKQLLLQDGDGTIRFRRVPTARRP